MEITRREFMAAGSETASALLATGSPFLSRAAAAMPNAHSVRISGVNTVEVRDAPTGKEPVLPWDARKIPRDTRDYVITQVLTDVGVVGTTMDGDYKLPAIPDTWNTCTIPASGIQKDSRLVLPNRIRSIKKVMSMHLRRRASASTGIGAF